MIFIVLAKFTVEDKRIQQKFLVEAESVTDSEVKFNKWLPKNYSDSEITSSSVGNITEIAAIDFNEESDVFYLVMLSWTEQISEKKSKKKSMYIMINSDSGFDGAYKNVKNYIENYSSVDYEIESIAASRIICDRELVNIADYTNPLAS